MGREGGKEGRERVCVREGEGEGDGEGERERERERESRIKRYVLLCY